MNQMNQMNEGQMRNRRAELLMQIGEYYAREIRSQRMQATPEIMPLLDEIAQMDVQIAYATGTFAENTGVCPNCQNTIVPGTMFCANCGYNMMEHAQQFIGNCKRCNAQIKMGQKFCEVCGIVL